MKVLAAVDDDRLAGDNVAPGPHRKTTAPTTSSGTWSAAACAEETETCCSASITFRMLANAVAHREARCDTVDEDVVPSELLRERNA